MFRYHDPPGLELISLHNTFQNLWNQLFMVRRIHKDHVRFLIDFFQSHLVITGQDDGLIFHTAMADVGLGQTDAFSVVIAEIHGFCAAADGFQAQISGTGKQIDADKITAGIELLAAAKATGAEAGLAAAKAIMTTDTVHKQAAVTVEISGKTVTVGGMCKGSGMIHPNMCTMLGFVTTDVNISKEMLNKAVKASVAETFNMISVDGDTSTNDTLLVLANGLAGNAEITEEGADFDAFCQALNTINTTLAKKMAGDGEGATALFETIVTNAATKEDAKILAKSVICSSLTKAAIFGHDANWGRILCALGYSGAKFDPENVDLYFQSKSGKIHIFGNGVACDYSEEEATKILSDPEVTVLVDMHMGEAQATAWGCDLSYDYVKINADYRS